MKIGNIELQENAEIKASVCMIGPSEAKELLKRNTNNRKASEAVIQKYKTEMDMGEWYATSSGIGFDDNGVLTDGQQRLMAIVLHGKSVPLLCVTHLAPKSQIKQDRQRRRTLADVFFLSKICDDKEVVQVATFLAFQENGGRFSPADAMVEAALSAHHDSLFATRAAFKKHEKGIGQVGFRAAIAIAYEVHGQKAIDFASLVRSELHTRSDDPAFRLRQCLLGLTATRVKQHSGGGGRQIWAYKRALYAFNAWMMGRKISSVLEADDVVAVDAVK